jgi:hypothetical protein
MQPLKYLSGQMHAWAAFLVALPFLVHAQNIPILNAGFESNNITPGAFVVLQPQGWLTYDPVGMIDNANNAVGVIRPLPGTEYFPGGTPEGNNAALVFLAGPQTGEAGLQQTLTATLQADTRYRCSVQIGNIASGWSLPGSSGGASNYFDLDGFPGYRIDVLAGANVVGSDNNSIGTTIPEGEFRQARFHFDTGPSPAQLGQPLGIRLVNLKAPGTPTVPNIEVDFDEVVLTAGPIPAAAQLSIVLMGGQPTIGVTGTTGATYRVEFAGALPATNWMTLTNLFLPTSPQFVSDAEPVLNQGSRYYRAVVVE